MNKYIGIGIVIIVLIGIIGFVLVRRERTKIVQNIPALAEQTELQAEPQELGQQTNQSEQADDVQQVSAQTFEHDRDRDGILDTEEEKLGTSDEAFDTDKDGISDQLEINDWKTDPKKADTDGDGFSDGLEILQGYNPRGEGRISQ